MQWGWVCDHRPSWPKWKYDPRFLIGNTKHLPWWSPVSFDVGHPLRLGRRQTVPQSTWLTIPLWIPLVLTASPAAYLFYRDRRIPPHCCQSCGYDLTGNTSGVCPECGVTAT